ncbi:MAG: MATE family efflux transporter [Bacillaceae bacterium]
MKNAFMDKAFLRTMITLAIPITIQSFITASLGLVDNMMVGNLGESAIASVGLANQYILIFTLCIFGIGAGSSIFMSQFWGKKDIESIKTFLGLNLAIGTIVAVLFGLAAFFLAPQIMGIFTDDAQVVGLGADYLKIIAVSCLFLAVTIGYSTALRSTEQTKLPMYASVISVIINVFLNWVFIFGNLGVEPMGVAGSALATAIARFVEMVVVVGVVYITKNKVAANIKELCSFRMAIIKTYFVTSWSVIVNELIWSMGMSAYSIAYAKISTNAVATMQIGNILNNLFMVFLIGLANASSIVIGNKIGAGEDEEAREYAKYIAVWSVIMGVVLGIAVWFTAPIMLKPFSVTAETYADTIAVLRLMALFFVLRAFNVVMIVGVFRGGGDTTYVMLLQSVTMWLYSIPLAYIGAAFFHLPITTVFFIVCTEEIVKLIFQIQRLRSGKWLHNVIEKMQVAA